MSFNKWLMVGVNFLLAYGMYLNIGFVFGIVYVLLAVTGLGYLAILCLFDGVKHILLKTYSEIPVLQWVFVLLSQILWVYIAVAASNITFLYFYGIVLSLCYTIFIRVLLLRNK